MSAWVSPVCGLAFTMLSIFTASTRFSEGTGSPVNGDRSYHLGPRTSRGRTTTPPRYHNGLPGGSPTPRATREARPYSTATAVAP